MKKRLSTALSLLVCLAMGLAAVPAAADRQKKITAISCIFFLIIIVSRSFLQVSCFLSLYHTARQDGKRRNFSLSCICNSLFSCFCIYLWTDRQAAPQRRRHPKTIRRNIS